MKRTITALFTLSLLFISYRSLTNINGPPAGRTNAPGELTCSDAVTCHGVTTSSGPSPIWNTMNLSVTGGVPTLANLVQNTTYNFSLTFTNAASVRYGFQLCVLPSGATSATASLGTLITSSSQTQIVSGGPSGNRTYLEHNSSGVSVTGGSKTWTFQWRTPVSYVGGATFYVIVNSTDNNGIANSGDLIYAKTFAATVAMPVSWLDTKTEADKGGVLIRWATASEENNWKFEIEKSADQKEWKTIGEVKGMGNSSMINKYSFRDANVNGTAYYRVKQIDFNGEYSYSTMVFVKSNTANNAEPTISYNADEPGYVVRGNGITGVQVMDMKGEIKYITSGSEYEQFIPTLATGMYLVQIQTKTTGTYYQKIVMF